MGNDNRLLLKIKVMELKELNQEEQIAISGGNPWALIAMYILFETAADPVGSWNAFKRGWNSI